MFITRSRPTRAFRGVVRAVSDITVPSTIAGSDGLLPITELANDLVIHMPWWNGVAPETRLQAGWKAFTPGNPENPDDDDLVGTHEVVSVAQAADPTTVFNILVPKDLLIHGVYLLNVRTQTVPGNAKEWSQSIRIEVDTVAPGGGAFPYIVFNGPVESSKNITDDDIVDAKLPGAVAHYEGIAPGDEVTPLINGTPDAANVLVIPDPVPNEDFLAIYFSESALLALNNNTVDLSYSVKDKAGNKDTARDQFLNVDLRSKPENLLAPLVPKSDDGLIDDADARAPVQVLIPKFDKARVDDEIIVHWGNQVADGVKLTKEDIENDPFIAVQLPYAMVFDAGKGTVNVKYFVNRAGKEVGDSPDKPVEVDLTLIGNPDPIPETPVHENLLPPKVISDSGSGEENNIPPEHYEEPAQVVIPWLAKDGAEIYIENDEIFITWGDQVGSKVLRTVLGADVTAKIDLIATIPKETISAQGGGTIQVFYTASRVTTVPPHENTSLSPSQPVTVTNATELPGGGNIDAPEFPVLNEFDAIGPDELLDGPNGLYNPVRVVTTYTHAEVGDTVELFFVGYDDLSAGNPVPGAAYNPQPPYTITQDDLDLGYYDFNVPAKYHYAVCTRGAVEAHVIVRNSFGSTTGSKKRVFCDVKMPGWEDCNNRP